MFRDSKHSDLKFYAFLSFVMCLFLLSAGGSYALVEKAAVYQLDQHSLSYDHYTYNDAAPYSATLNQALYPVHPAGKLQPTVNNHKQDFHAVVIPLKFKAQQKIYLGLKAELLFRVIPHMGKAKEDPELQPIS